MFRVRTISIYLKVSRPDGFNLPGGHEISCPNDCNLPESASARFQFTPLDMRSRVRTISIYLIVSRPHVFNVPRLDMISRVRTISIYLKVSRPNDFNLPQISLEVRVRMISIYRKFSKVRVRIFQFTANYDLQVGGDWFPANFL